MVLVCDMLSLSNALRLLQYGSRICLPMQVGVLARKFLKNKLVFDAVCFDAPSRCV
uniref:Uncharacterized protein n=1 Tax=Arundo donax TaxID=35708 RepID=A0A0A8YWJ5_ARUDO